MSGIIKNCWIWYRIIRISFKKWTKGLWGRKIGGAQVSPKHAGFIVNDGTATAEDVINLIEYIKKTVKEKFNKELEREVIIIGE